MMNKFTKAFNLLFLIIACLWIGACGHEQPKLKPLYPGDTILAFGDSLTYGTGATPETSYPQDLANMTGFKVINAGIPGEETQDSLKRISTELEQNQPRLVIICIGGNDLLRKRPHETIKENIKKLVQMTQASGAQVVLIGVPEPGLNLSAPGFYEELGKELNVPVDSATIPKLLKTQKYKSDYIHLNQEGYQALAENIVDLLKKQGAIAH